MYTLYCIDMVFSNGCRAPPWRQVLGDICYITVVPGDDVELCVSATTEGYFVNKVSEWVVCILNYSYTIYNIIA